MYLELFEVLEQVMTRARELGVRIWPGNNLGYFGPLEQSLRKAQNKHFRGCNAGVTTLGIESNGALKNCPSLGGPLNVGGSWREHGVKKVWEQSYQLGYIRARTRDDLWGFCGGCYYAETCMGGCTAAAEPLLGRPGNNPFCYHRASELAAVGLRERIEQVAGAAGGGFDNGLFRILREHLDPELRARHGVLEIDEPRCSRAIEPHGPGHTVTVTPAPTYADAAAGTA
jgi:radical SAM protein with 4Fe4S-binding SPASM domain